MSPGPERADVLLELAATRRVDSLTMIALCDQALEVEALDERRIARLLAYRSFAHMIAGDVAPALRDAREALARSEEIGDPAMVAAAIARVGQAETYSAEATPDCWNAARRSRSASTWRWSTTRARGWPWPAWRCGSATSTGPALFWSA